jgi:hypothetical protein
MANDRNNQPAFPGKATHNIANQPTSAKSLAGVPCGTTVSGGKTISGKRVTSGKGG